MALRTELVSTGSSLDTMSTAEIVQTINNEDKKVADAVSNVLPTITTLVEKITTRVQQNGRLFYIGAGTSGRLGVLDASELPPTFGVSSKLVVGIIAGGDRALRTSVENAEDSFSKGWEDLQDHQLSPKDTLVGIAASGHTPYVVGACERAGKEGLLTACICMNKNAPLEKVVQCPVIVDVGPECIAGSTRMKSGTAQKMILNIISTTLMILLGKVEDNQMTHMQLSNNKLRKRGAHILAEKENISYAEALKIISKYKNLHTALASFSESKSAH